WEQYTDSTGDPHVVLMKSVFELKDDSSAMTGVSYERAARLLTDGLEEELYDEILEKYDLYKAGKEFVLIEGGSLSDELVGTDINSRIANTLDAPSMCG
ncbi:hypothetical protein SARC_17574, partial [Sphaeroforma arctica JP610]